MSNFYNDSIFWVEVDKIKPNPLQPRREFDGDSMRALADSIKQYGVLQALVVTRKEIPKDDGLAVEYELIAGERRLRASKMAGLSQVPVIIRVSEGEKLEDDLMKLELAIIENVQREDLNPVERAHAFKKLADQFGFKHHQIAQKVGKSRVYVTNTMRILDLPEEMLNALSEGKINEGHTRPLLMLIDRPEEQKVLFQDIILRKMSVRDTEQAARKIAIERVRKIDANLDPEILALEEKFTERLGTRVKIEKKENGGKLTIDFFSNEDLQDLLDSFNKNRTVEPEEETKTNTEAGLDDRSKEEIKEDNETPVEEDLYSIKNFSI
ncbi:MAG: ParB/RepB/Spo0J family partition protein [Candidatus Zambryskibacteria bacterium]|nr:ParB/RepB/Spo0J family partition protein [Candidatus Zambryskibacteria bacterium]